ncbi:MAG: hypothetical protein KDK54_09220 [Leptospiraceae bacterium]|nr:hypothetical protein [Leptospiraceae bacterium]
MKKLLSLFIALALLFGSEAFSDEEKNDPKESILVGFVIRHGDIVDGLTPIYKTLDGKYLGNIQMGDSHGGKGGRESIAIRSNAIVQGLIAEKCEYFGADHICRLRVIWKRWSNGSANGDYLLSEYYGTGNFGTNQKLVELSSADDLPFKGVSSQNLAHTNGDLFLSDLKLISQNGEEISFGRNESLSKRETTVPVVDETVVEESSEPEVKEEVSEKEENSSEKEEIKPSLSKKSCCGNSGKQSCGHHEGGKKSCCGESGKQSCGHHKGGMKSCCGDSGKQSCGHHEGGMKSCCGDSGKHSCGEQDGSKKSCCGESSQSETSDGTETEESEKPKENFPNGHGVPKKSNSSENGHGVNPKENPNSEDGDCCSPEEKTEEKIEVPDESTKNSESDSSEKTDSDSKNSDEKNSDS